MLHLYAFRPLTKALAIAATATDQTLALPAGVGDVLHIVNGGAAPLLCAFGTATADSDPDFDMAIAAGETCNVWVGRGVTHIACRLATGTGTVYVTRGDGR